MSDRLRVRLQVSCNLEDNLYWTAVNLEKLQAQTIDCEYKASMTSTIVVNRPKWAAKLMVLAVLGKSTRNSHHSLITGRSLTGCLRVCIRYDRDGVHAAG